MTLKLNGSTAGSVSIDAPANTNPSGSDVTLTLPVNDGDAGQVLKTDGSGALSWTTPGLVFTQTAEITLPTDAAYYEWTGIPAAWKRLRLCMYNTFLNSGEITLGGITSGYSSGGSYVASGNAIVTSTSAFVIYGGGACHIIVDIMPMDASGTPDKYICTHNGTNGTSSTRSGGGALTGVSSSITSIKLTNQSGNFQNGTACLQYEVPAS